MNAIKIRLDHDSSSGQYLITGSSNLRFTKAVKDSLAGRLGRIRLRTLAFGEISGGRGDFIRCAFERDFPSSLSAFDKRDVIHAAFCGGYQGDFKHLKWFRDNLAKGDFTGIVLYSGNETLSFGSQCYAVPLSALAI